MKRMKDLKQIKRKIGYLSLCFCMILASATSGLAGGALETIDITNLTPSPVPGLITAPLVGIKWDARSMPVKYRVNDTLDPIPNPLGAPVLSLADARATFQAAFDGWNNIPTSYIDMRIIGTVSNPVPAGFDFVNEVTFRTTPGFAAIAVSPSTELIADSTLADGDDLDGDGDSDVSSTIRVCTDVDGDGDIEFPAGFYKAGTILDNDVLFNVDPALGFRFTTGDAALDTNPLSVDLLTVAAHEFGHSQGLSHTLDNQISNSNGDGSTMYPFIDTGDPFAELGQRSLSEDDKAWSSYFYPEGTSFTGPAAIQRGDIPFNFKYGLIKGELRHGVLNQGIAGGSVYAYNELTNERAVSAFSGKAQVLFNPLTGGIFISGDPTLDIVDGSYVIPTPLGIYSVGIEPTDGQPVGAGSISLTAQLGAIYGQQNFNEEFFNGKREDARELKLSERTKFLLLPGQTKSGIDIVTSDSININNFGALNFVGFVNPIPAGSFYAVQVPASQITGVNPGGELLIQGVSFHTFVTDASVIPAYAKAMLTTGVVNPDGTVAINVARPLEVKNNFIGQDNDFAPFYFDDPKKVGRKVLKGIADGSIQNLFIVLQLPATTPFPGVSAQPPLIGLSSTGPQASFLSVDGGTSWTRQTVNFRFSLVLSLPLPSECKR